MCKPLNHDQEFFTLTLEQLREERVIPRAAFAVEREHDEHMTWLASQQKLATLYRDRHNVEGK